MLNFPKEYFCGEEREGFYVDETMKTVWAAELEVLNEVATICATHDICWYAAYGTLLGAVRHQGFIPWDDDIDIWVRRKDYRRLLALLQNELPKEFVVRGPHAREGYPEYQVYVNNGDSISVEPSRLEKFHGCPFFVGIDIFPLDDIPINSIDIDIQRSIFAGTLLLQQKGVEDIVQRSEILIQINGILNTLQARYGIYIDRHLLKPENEKKLLDQLWRTAEVIGSRNGSNHLAMYLDYLKYGKIYETAWFDETVYLPFEGFDVPVPENYDAVLRVIYGDYTVYVRSGALHDYPCYKRQLEELRKKVAERTVDNYE